ncbi:MAG: hypothetical protein ACK40G_13865 [Cytophagaceae bacterium]
MRRHFIRKRKGGLSMARDKKPVPVKTTQLWPVMLQMGLDVIVLREGLKDYLRYQETTRELCLKHNLENPTLDYYYEELKLDEIKKLLTLM